MQDDSIVQQLRDVSAEIKRVQKYLTRSAKALRRNTKRLKTLERKREMLLTPMLPGLFD